MNTSNEVSARVNRIDKLRYIYADKTMGPVRDCNLCGADRWIVVSHKDRYGYAISAMACSKCGLTMLNPCMTQVEYSSFYQHTYRPLVSAYHGRNIDSKSVQEDQLPYANQMVKLVSPLMSSEYKSMLDVGGSTGIISGQFAKEFGLKCTVIDPAPAETAEAAAAGIETVTGFVEDWDCGDKKFDVIGIFQTVDHLFDIHLTLTKLRSIINDGGLFIMDIVDFRAAYLRNNSVENALKIDHIYSLTQEVTEAYLVSTGFEWIRKSYSEDHLHVVYICTPSNVQPKTIPDPEVTRDYFKELRYIQNLSK